MHKMTVWMLCLVMSLSWLSSCNGQLPPCPDGSTADCTCADGSPLDLSQPIPCDISKGRPNCVCADGSKPPVPSPPPKPCQSGRPKCDDNTAVPWQLTCTDGLSPQAQVGQPPKCSQGPLLCQDGSPLKCPDGSIPFGN